MFSQAERLIPKHSHSPGASPRTLNAMPTGATPKLTLPSALKPPPSALKGSDRQGMSSSMSPVGGGFSKLPQDIKHAVVSQGAKYEYHGPNPHEGADTPDPQPSTLQRRGSDRKPSAVTTLEPLWLSKSPFTEYKKGPPWARDSPRAIPAPVAKPKSSRTHRSSGESAPWNIRSRDYVLSSQSIDKLPREPKPAQFVREALQRFEDTLKERADEMSTRKSRLLKADSLQRALTNVTLGSSKESAAQPTLREIKMNELRQSKLVHAFKLKEVSVSELQEAFMKYASPEGLDSSGFRMMIADLLPEIDMDPGTAQSLYSIYAQDIATVVSLSEFIGLTGVVLHPPEKDQDISYLFHVLDKEDTGSVPRIRLSRKYLMGTKQAKAAKRRWKHLALQWDAVLQSAEVHNCNYFLTLNDFRRLVYTNPGLLGAHHRLRPFHIEPPPKAPKRKSTHVSRHPSLGTLPSPSSPHS
uniref:EF-hand domain-containing protein n=1 Tax=Eutreptiella gymnastica TaxID=73025 RepID=A0A7S4G9A0_9EUGL